MKTLAVYHKQLGDTLLLQPALAKLAEQDGEPVGLVTRPGFADLVNLMPGVKWVEWRPVPVVERLLSYDAGDRSSMVSFWCRARVKHLLTFSSFYVRFYHGWIFNHIHLCDQAQMYRGFYHWSCTTGEGDFEPPRLDMPPENWLPKEPLNAPFLMIHVTSAWQRKCWPASSWRIVVERMKSLTGLPVVLTGGVSEWERGLCAEIAAGMSGVTNLGGKTQLREIMAVASRASLIFTVDGFVSHLAAAFRRPCMTLFGPTNVNHWHLTQPWARAIYPGTDPGAAKGRKIADITVEDFWVRAEAWLREISFLH